MKGFIRVAICFHSYINQVTKTWLLFNYRSCKILNFLKETYFTKKVSVVLRPMEMKERILEKATELFTKYGIKRITMDEIAAKLGISKKTIYQSFHDKNELVSAIFDNHICISQQNCIVDEEKAENAVHEVLLGSETFINVMESINQNVLYDLEKFHPEVFQKFLQFKNTFMYNSIEKNLKRGIEEELYRKEIDLEVIIRLRLANIIISMNIELFPARQFNFVEVEREATLLFLHGIVTAKGARLIKKYSNRLPSVHHQHQLN